MFQHLAGKFHSFSFIQKSILCKQHYFLSVQPLFISQSFSFSFSFGIYKILELEMKERIMGKYWKESDCLSEPRTAVPKVLKKVSYRWCTKGKGKVNRCQLMHSSSLLFFKKLRHELTVQRFSFRISPFTTLAGCLIFIQSISPSNPVDPEY